jgi:hypothetical protein
MTETAEVQPIAPRRKYLGVSKLKWCLKQLLPLTYWTKVTRIRENEGKEVFIIWKMWLGRCYNVVEH